MPNSVSKIHGGRAEEAFSPLQMAIRLSPRDPQLNIWSFQICHAYTHLDRDADAIEWCRRSVAVGPVKGFLLVLANGSGSRGTTAQRVLRIAAYSPVAPPGETSSKNFRGGFN
jgi:adenylate cyclase